MLWLLVTGHTRFFCMRTTEYKAGDVMIKVCNFPALLSVAAFTGATLEFAV